MTLAKTHPGISHGKAYAVNVYQPAIPRRLFRASATPLRDNHANQLNPNNLEFWGSRNFGKHVRLLMKKQNLQQSLLDRWSPDTRVAALGKDAYLLLDGSGATKWWGIPTLLSDSVKAKGRAGIDPAYVALGPRGEYFVLYEDGHARWSSHSESLDQIIKEHDDQDVNLLAFAPDGGYFVKFDDGDWHHEGLPTSLDNYLNSNKPRVDSIAHLSISEDGSGWFVPFLDGQRPQWKAKGLPSRACNSIGGQQNSGIIRAVELGSSGNWLIRTTQPIEDNRPTNPPGGGVNRGQSNEGNRDDWGDC